MLKIDSIWVCAVADQTRFQNMVRASVTHSAAPGELHVPLFCSYLIMTLCEINYLTDHGNLQSVC